jgi:acetamidase/formamidase
MKCVKIFILMALSTYTLTSVASEKEESYLPFLPGPLKEADMLAPSKVNDSSNKTYILPATPSTTQWGFFDSSQTPVLHIKSGDSVVIETMTASYNQVVPGVTINELVDMTNADLQRGPHSVTGPIYIENAEPGDILKIHFNKIVPRAYASNNSLPSHFNRGLFPKQFPEGRIKYFYLDVENKKMEFAPGIEIPLRPFPGVIAVARQEPGKYDTAPPGAFGGNLDLREMVEGTTIYLPVFMKGGLLWTGDSHAAQGNGEIDLTAVETAFKEFNITVDLIKQKSLTWPRVETPTAWIAMGYDADLNKALDILKDETIKLIKDIRHVSTSAAEKMLVDMWDCPISEVVNGVKGAYCFVPKNTHASKPSALPTADNEEFFVTYATNMNIEKAMSDASMAMINKIVSKKHLSAPDTYILASLAMDCRIAPYTSQVKQVHCMLPKNLWK